MKTVKLTLHNGEDILVNWETVAFATPSTNEDTREVYTKLVFNSNGGEVDVRESMGNVQTLLGDIVVVDAKKKSTPRRK
jgi:hypothetical protein